MHLTDILPHRHLSLADYQKISDKLCMLQLTVHVLDAGGSSLLSKFWQSLPSTLVLPDCRITPSTDAESFIFWTPGRTPLAWSPSSGVLRIICADDHG